MSQRERERRNKNEYFIFTITRPNNGSFWNFDAKIY